MTNQLSNPSFETDLTGYQTSSATLTRLGPVGDAPDGSYTMQAAYTSGTNMLVNTNPQTVAAAPGDVWSAGAKARVSTGTARVFRVDVQFLDSVGTILSTVNAPTVTATGSYQQFVNEGITAPASTATVRIRTTYVGAVVGDALEMDAFQLELGATLPAYNPVAVLVTKPYLLESGAGYLLETGLPYLLES